MTKKWHAEGNRFTGGLYLFDESEQKYLLPPVSPTNFEEVWWTVLQVLYHVNGDSLRALSEEERAAMRRRQGQH